MILGNGLRIAAWAIRIGVMVALATLPTGTSFAGPRERGDVTSVPLAQRAASSAGTQFERLDSRTTGIHFVHYLEPDERHLRELDNGLVGGGVATGDFDGDGLADVYLTRPSGGNRLYRNLGGFRFENATEAAGVESAGLWSTGASFADVDGDGDLDLYVCGYDDPNRLYINRADGTFVDEAPARGVAFRGASVMMAFADYDLDGDLDGYLVTNRLSPSAELEAQAARFRQTCRPGRCEVPSHLDELLEVLPRPDVDGLQVIDAAQRDRLYRNDGAGRFTDVSLQAGIEGSRFGLSATWWDYDRDGYPDLYVANDFHGADQLLHNQHDGTFVDRSGEALPHTPWFSMGSDAADIDNDGWLDFIATDMSSTSHYKSKLTMGEMEENNWFLTYVEPPQYMRNAVYLNTGTGRFLEVAALAGLASTDWTWSVRFADLDNDGLSDLFVSNGMTRYWFNSDLRRQAAEAAKRGQDAQVWLDSPKRSEPNLAFRNQGDLRFKSVGTPWGLDHVGVSFGASLADLDRDGDLDLIVNNFEEAAGVYRNGSVEGHGLLVRLVGRNGNSSGIGARIEVRTGEVEQVRYVTLARGFASADEPVAHFGLGSAATVDRLTVHWPGGRRQHADRLAADRFYTLTEPGSTAGRPPPPAPAPTATLFAPGDWLDTAIHRERPYDDFERQPLLPGKLSQLGPGMAWGDVNGDGLDDVFLAGAAGQAGRLMVRTADGFRQVVVPDLDADRESEDMGAVFLDFDADADLDLFVASGGVECDPGSEVLRDRLYVNDGNGGFARAPAEVLPDLRESGSVVAAADFDRDGRVDLFVGSRSVPGAYPETPRSRLLRNLGGRFGDVTDDGAPGLGSAGLVTGAVWSDADDDGWVDLLVTRDWGSVQLWRNLEGRLEDRTEAAGLGAFVGWFNGIAARDLDNDGDLDYVVTNAGLNSKYHATTDEPVRLYYGDFDGSGRKHLVEAHVEVDRWVPVRGRSCSSAAMPHLAESFGSFQDFARASLPEVYAPEQLEQAQLFEANTLESAVLVNGGSGGFTFRPLPRLAQVSPGFGVVLEDLNADGFADIALAHNFFGPQAETGRMDGGLGAILLGDGTGEFRPLRADRSGFVVTGDATGLASTDLNDDGRVDLVVARNDDAPRVFLNQSESTNRVLRVHLRGRPGNPTAVGARVRVRLANGQVQTAEVHAGSSYLTQSSPGLTFGLGRRKGRARTVEVTWPDGTTTVSTPRSDRLEIVQP